MKNTGEYKLNKSINPKDSQLQHMTKANDQRRLIVKQAFLK